MKIEEITLKVVSDDDEFYMDQKLVNINEIAKEFVEFLNDVPTDNCNFRFQVK